jgi:hypothetical protein
MLGYILLTLFCALLAVTLPKIQFYFTSLYKARQFAKTSPLPSVTIYSPRDYMPFWLVSPWIAPAFEILPFKLGHWIRYVKRDFSP